MFPVETEWPSLQVQHREALSPIKVPDVRLASSLDPIPTQQTISSEVIVPGLQRLVSAHSRDANARTIEPVTLATPTSSVWEQSAIQWTDTMVRDGDGKAALDACERMLEIRRGLPSGVICGMVFWPRSKGEIPRFVRSRSFKRGKLEVVFPRRNSQCRCKIM